MSLAINSDPRVQERGWSCRRPPLGEGSLTILWLTQSKSGASKERKNPVNPGSLQKRPHPHPHLRNTVVPRAPGSPGSPFTKAASPPPPLGAWGPRKPWLPLPPGAPSCPLEPPGSLLQTSFTFLKLVKMRPAFSLRYFARVGPSLVSMVSKPIHSFSFSFSLTWFVSLVVVVVLFASSFRRW